MPDSRQENFDRDLSERNWRVKFGKPQNIIVADKKLIIKGSIELNYRYYPLRSLKSRPPFGDFSANAGVSFNKRTTAFSWGACSQQSKVFVEFNPAKNIARIAYKESGNEVKAMPWIKLETVPGKQSLKMVRVGNSIVFYCVKGKHEKLIGEWRGNIPEIFDLFISTKGNGTPLEVSSWTLLPRPHIRGFFTVKDQPGTVIKFTGDKKYEDIGGGELYNGFLWKLNEKAQFKVEITNPSNQANDYQLQLIVRDWMEHELTRKKYKVTVEAGSKQMAAVELLNDRFGFFNAELALSLKGEPTGASQVIGYGITAALDTDKVAKNAVLGIHSFPFSRLGINHVRYWDNGGRAVCWSGIQPEKNTWEFGGIDAYVNKTLAAGMTPLVVLGMTPKWASTNPKGKSHRGPGAYSPPKDMNDWRIFCRKMAIRYKGQVKHYEIWNEPNNNGLKPKGFFFHDDVNKYFEMMKAAYEELKAVDPQIQVVAPSATGSFFAFLNKLLELGGGRYFDILSIHTYTAPFPPEIGYQFNSEKSYGHRVTRARGIMKKYGCDKPVWNTEVGYHSGMRTKVGSRFLTTDIIAEEALENHWPNWKKRWSFRPLDPRRSAAFYTRFGILSMVYGVERIYIHHRLIDGGRSPYIAAPALGWMNNILGGAKFIRKLKSPANINMLLFKLKKSGYCVVGYQIYPESLFMRKKERKIANLDSAPVSEGLAKQEGIDDSVAKSTKRSSYFAPGELRYINLKISSRPDECYDMWGNKIESHDLKLDENPLYIKFESIPEALTVKYQRSNEIINLAKAIRQPFHGTLQKSPGPVKMQVNIEDVLGKPVNVSLRKARFTDGTSRNPKSWPVLSSKRSLSFDVPQNSPSRGRILLLARSGKNYEYFLDKEGQRIELSRWTVWPESEYMRRKKWVIMRGFYISPEVELNPGMKMKLSAQRSHSHIFRIQVIPTNK